MEASGEPGGPLQAIRAWFVGPKLQFANLLVLFLVVELTLDYPNPLPYVALCVITAALADGLLSRWRYGGWRIPWPSMVGALGITLLVDGFGPLAFVLLGLIMVVSKHAIRWRGKHLFNPNNLAACVLIVAGLVRVGVNDWGAAPQVLALMFLFGTIATTRVGKFDLAIFYLALSFTAYALVSWWQGWSLATAWMFALSPVQVMVGLFAITDPATSPTGTLEKLLWAGLIVLVGVPATLAGYPEAPLFALLVVAPQRHLVTYLVRGTWPPASQEQGGGASARSAAPVPGGEPV